MADDKTDGIWNLGWLPGAVTHLLAFSRLLWETELHFHLVWSTLCGCLYCCCLRHYEVCSLILEAENTPGGRIFISFKARFDVGREVAFCTNPNRYVDPVRNASTNKTKINGSCSGFCLFLFFTIFFFLYYIYYKYICLSLIFPATFFHDQCFFIFVQSISP